MITTKEKISRRSRGNREAASYSPFTKNQYRLPLTDEDKQAIKDSQRKSYVKKCSTPGGKAQSLFKAAKKRAEKAGLDFDLTERWIERRILRGVCERSGIKFDLSYSDINTKRQKYSPSLDRIDNRRGYTKQNTQVVVSIYNISKNEYTDADLMEFCQKVWERQFLGRLKEEGAEI